MIGKIVGRLAQGLFDQVIFGLEVSIKAAMGQAQGFHQRLQARGADAITPKARRRFIDDPLMSLGFMVFRIAHYWSLPIRAHEMVYVIFTWMCNMLHQTFTGQLPGYQLIAESVR